MYYTIYGSVWAIPTYRVYRLYEKYKYEKELKSRVYKQER